MQKHHIHKTSHITKSNISASCGLARRSQSAGRSWQYPSDVSYGVSGAVDLCGRFQPWRSPSSLSILVMFTNDNSSYTHEISS